MAQSTKKAKTQALPAQANALRHISTNNRLGDLLQVVEDDFQVDDTGTLASSNSEADADSSSHDSSEDDDPTDEKSVSSSDTAVAPPEVAARSPSPAPVVTGKRKRGRPPVQGQGTIHILNHSRTQCNYYREPKEENYLSHRYSHP